MFTSDKEIFVHKGERFIKDSTTKEKLKKIEKIKTDLSLEEENEYMTLYATHKGVIVLKHEDRDSASNAININKVYYRQLWRYDEEKEAYKYVAEYKKGTEIIY